MRRRRRSRGTWFPTLGQTAGGESAENDISGRDLELDLDGTTGSLQTATYDLTYDYPKEPTDASQDKSLADIIGSEYVLQRIVGKCFLEYSRGADNDDAFAALVCAGFFVARADDAGEKPIGEGNLAYEDYNRAYSPLEVRTQREPWIWRRTWLLCDDLLYNTAAAGFAPRFPKSTALYGSVADGPHIDSKVKRRISSDNRLYFAISACPYPVGSYAEGSTFGKISGWLDYRIFGSLRKAKQGSAF